MSSYLDDLLKSGKRIISDTKTPAPVKQSKDKKALGPLGKPEETNPHKILVRRTIQEKPKKSELIEEFAKFIKAEEECL